MLKITILDNIRYELDRGIISQKDLETFLNIKRIKKPQKEKNKNITKKYDTTKNPEGKKEENENGISKENDKDEEEVKEKLGLMTLVLKKYNPITKYTEYKEIIYRIK